jgi:hypothetical protein
MGIASPEFSWMRTRAIFSGPAMPPDWQAPACRSSAETRRRAGPGDPGSRELCTVSPELPGDPGSRELCTVSAELHRTLAALLRHR